MTLIVNPEEKNIKNYLNNFTTSFIDNFLIEKEQKKIKVIQYTHIVKAPEVIVFEISRTRYN